MVKKPPADSRGAGDAGLITGLEGSPGVGNATHSSFLAWKIPWTEESSRMQSVGWEESDATFSLNFQAFLSFFFFFKTTRPIHRCVSNTAAMGLSHYIPEWFGTQQYTSDTVLL